MNLLQLGAILCSIWFVSGKVAKTGEEDLTVAAIDYLRRNGYYDAPEAELGSIANMKTITESIKSLQRFAGLPETGILDDGTKTLMKTDRCGLPDITKTMKTKRKRRYVLQGSKWNTKSTLTWRLQNDNNDGLTRVQVETMLHKAFLKWQSVTSLNFVKIHHTAKEEADIEVKFVQNYHNDPYPFDGLGGTLAHAFYPHNNRGLSGDVHFDDDEKFTLGKDGRNLLWIAVHEIGHSLGLEHSSSQEAVMYPWYKRFDGDDFDLNIDDITGVQQLYGSKSNPNPKPKVTEPTQRTKSTTTTTKSKPVANGCTGVFKSVFLDKSSRKTYVINNDKVYTLNSNLVLEKGPREISSVFPGIDRVDAVYTRSDGRIVFFKETRYFIVESVRDPRVREQGSIYRKFQGLPSSVKRIDAAFVWSRNGRTYLFSGDQYYRFDEYRQSIDPNYPRKIESAWNGVPAHVDSVFEWNNGVTYFFKGGNYYRLNNQYVRVVKNYPKSIIDVWTRCGGRLIGRNENSGAAATKFNSFVLLTMSFSLVLQKVLF